MENTNYELISRLFNNFNIEILQHGLFHGDTHWNYDHVNSPFNRLYFMLDGEAHMYTQGGKITLEPGKMYLVPLHSTNTYVGGEKFCKFYIHFKAELFFGSDVFEVLNDFSGLPYDTQKLQNILETLARRDMEGVFTLKAFLYECLQRYFHYMSSVPGEQIELLYKYRAVYQRIRDRCSFKLSPGGLAGELGMPNIAKDFKEDTGRSLKSYIDSVVLDKAKEKILLTDMSIKGIAYELDFNDEFYFSRFFKRHTGLCPREYRLKNRFVYS